MIPKKVNMQKSSHQVHMVKDEGGLVHLTQDQKHLVVDELFVLFEVAAHVLLQLVTDLWTSPKHPYKYGMKERSGSIRHYSEDDLAHTSLEVMFSRS